MPKRNKLPPHIVEIVKEYKKETYEHPGVGVKYGESIYFYIFYRKSRSYLLIREDGTVLPFDQVKPIITLSANLAGLTQQMEISSARYTKRLTRFMYTRVLRRLTSLEEVYGASMPQEIKNAFDTFKNVAAEIIVYQNKIKEAYQMSLKIINKYFEKGVVTIEDRDRLRSCHLQLVRSLYYQEGERVIFHGEEFEDDKKVLVEIFASTLNPKT